MKNKTEDGKVLKSIQDKTKVIIPTQPTLSKTNTVTKADESPPKTQ